MNKKFVVAFSLVGFLCFGLFGQVFAQANSSGVQSGDYFTFSINTYWRSSNVDLTAPVYLTENNNTRYYDVSVLSVSGANVTATNSWEFYNGTTGSTRVEMEVGNGTVYFYIQGFPAFQGFFPANLNAGDLLRPLANDDVRINRTESREYAGNQREVNVVSIDYQVTDYYNTIMGNETITYYIDRATGVLMERVDYTEFPDQNGSLEWKLIATNAWTASPTQASSSTISINPTASPNLSPSSSPTQQPTLHPSQIAGDNQIADFTPAIIIVSAIIVTATALLLYFKKQKKMKAR